MKEGMKINMHITNEARDLLKQVLQERNSAGIRIFFAGYG